ncbi:suppressor protein stp22 of temperature-sensitive alpha-factor receptor and arginine permease [Purpureocillium takamizusanense]|uniref:Suppressor protein stp22 of temperature-sensitive alpha-factor receptor and arginine permease n=1 Tax=Purpureocillium takamizusanense TaxID=2060973 RepID=A0A9Q8Q944_9HYPO|nr:suppressor protein stp22 of temperature-sensitive alpha-factor receptor and arginine permease [Purpureocillium takamizusanense]UNI15315.1 suppressor protein stp22 of temperature-sensitive alpha-factor receptor and arginine permease [Purpureocillium takamizusanense]
MPVQQHVLNWLYSVLTSEYHDVNRTYSDVARVLNRFSTLSPRTDVHTFPNGASALLLHISGTIPVIFRANTYRFPLSIWVPHAYPREPPLVYVTPTETMMVRPGQHVDPQGQVYHPYLVRWTDFWDKSTIEDFLIVLSDVFAKEPPVISRQAQRPTTGARPTPTPPPVPPLPPEMAPPTPQTQPRPNSSDSHPPRPPPKPHQEPLSPHSPSYRSPPVAAANSSPVSSRYDSVPPLPPQAQTAGPAGYRPQPPPPSLEQHTQQPQPRHVAGPAMTSGPNPHSMPDNRTQVPPYAQQNPPAYLPQGHWQAAPAAWNGTAVPQQPPQAAPPLPNILDEPLTLEVPPKSAVAAPPIPPNPEKDALLRQLAQTLASIRQRSRQQNDSSLAGLRAQRMAMQGAVPALQSEMSQLTQLSNVLTSNTNILHEALRKADGVIESSKNHPAPDIDELLVAPTVVSNQLYTLVAEERALGDAIFMLGRAVERGRVSPVVFAKMTRSLAREWYLKKALVRKIGQGMGMAS